MSYFAVVFMVFLQVSPYLIPGGPTEISHSSQMVPLKTSASPNTPPKHIGRTLLWKRDTSEVETDYISDRMKQANKGQFNSSSTVYANMTKSVLCNDYFNKTESMRLESELRDWLTRFQLEEKKLLLQQQKQSNRRLKSNQGPRGMNKGSNNKRLLFDSKYVPIPRLKLWMQKQKYGGDYLSEQFEAGSGGSNDHNTGSAAESLFGLDYKSLLATVHRRDDTFYYLSYPSKGHLILPPISNRSDVRPRFSFLIPTFHNLSLDESHRHSNANLNSSSGGNGNNSPQMFILQIDCQVINTKVILINDEAQGFGNKTDQLRPPKMYKTRNINGGK